MQLENLLKVRVGENIFGFDADKIEQILRVLPITTVPLSSEAIPGVCVILGKIFSIIDLGIVLGISSVNKDQESARILSISDDSALIVDEVLDIVKVEQENYEEVNDDELIVGFYKDQDQVVQILDEKKILQNIELIKYLPKEIDAINTSDTSSKQNNNKNSSTTNRYLFFSANNEEFAIDIELLKEIIFVPEITPITSNKAMGMITLRDEVISLLDFNKLFSFVENEITDKSRCLIIWHNNKQIAILVDDVKEVSDISLSDIEQMSQNYEDSKIEAIYKGGKKLVSIVSKMYLFTLVKDYFINEKNEETMIKVEKEENMSEVAVFKISNEEYAFDIEDVKEIIRYEQITPIPEAPEFVEGLFNLRGSVIPVVSLQERLGFEKNIDDKTKIIVCNVQDDRVGFIVDDVSDILFIDDQNISQAKNKEAIFDEVINLDNGKSVILKISADKVLSEETLKNIKMASE